MFNCADQLFREDKTVSIAGQDIFGFSCYSSMLIFVHYQKQLTNFCVSPSGDGAPVPSFESVAVAHIHPFGRLAVGDLLHRVLDSCPPASVHLQTHAIDRWSSDGINEFVALTLSAVAQSCPGFQL